MHVTDMNLTEVEGLRAMSQCPRKQIFGGGGCGSDGNKTCINSFVKQGGDKPISLSCDLIFGGDVLLQIDPSIYGGLIVEFQQKVLDMSIRTRAQQMERLLREPVDISSL
ncbi:unnamed protein product [Microthlaspi erraticum]|uniref:Uncharacterized protein n=1 Tax=Microthlaspi erraticum TaxID=1685480 RepID=A0A6D2ITR0_9BRAS|nr:unnamed protein product [Microthlaspi erraticum]